MTTPPQTDEATQRQQLAGTKRWIVKIGSSLISRLDDGLDYALIESWSEQIVTLREAGVEMALVSSGAVAAGMERTGLSERPTKAGALRALAAIGQPRLVHAYESVFARHDIPTALMLLTHEDFHRRARYLNMRSTLDSLISMGTIPILNENDTVTTEEIRFGDNDILAALAADLASASVLVILTDRTGLYNKNPTRHPDAQLIPLATATDPTLDTGADTGGHLGQGGMVTKLKAARRAALSGCLTLIADGREPNILPRLRSGAPLGTILLPPSERLSARKRWIHSQQHPRGELHLDPGAIDALIRRGKSLLMVGVHRITGDFQSGDFVACIAPDGETVAYGITKLSSDEARQLIGLDSSQIKDRYPNLPSEIIHRNDLALKDAAPPS